MHLRVKERLNNMSKKIFIIDVYATTENKLNMLRKCIRSLEPMGIDTMIVAHCSIPEDIIKSVTYYLYDKNNKFNKNYVYGWRIIDGIEIRNQVNESHEYPIISAMRLAFNAAKSMGYDYFYFTEFDVEYSTNGLAQLQELENRIMSENKDFAFFYPKEAIWGDIIGQYYETIIFTGKLRPFVEKFEAYFPSNLDEYNEKFASRFPNCLEHFFWDCFKRSSNVITEKYANQYFSDSNINVSSYRNTRCEILLDPDENPYFVINNNDNFNYKIKLKVGDDEYEENIAGSNFKIFPIKKDCDIQVSLYDGDILHLNKTLTYSNLKKEEYKANGAIIFHKPNTAMNDQKRAENTKDIFIISAYPDVEGKEELLNDTVTKLKSLGKTVLLASHYAIPAYIVEKADYYIYDAFNMMNVDHTLERDGPDYWMETDGFRLETIVTAHSSALSRMFGLALDFAKSAGYDYFIVMESDSDYDISDLKKFDDLKKQVVEEDKKLFFFKPKWTEFSWNNSRVYETYCFGGLIDEFTKKLKFPTTPDAWRSLYLADTKINCFEYFLYKHFGANESEYVVNGTLKSFMINSKVDLFTVGDPIGVYYNSNDELKPIIFISNNSDRKLTYNISAGANLSYTKMDMSPGHWWMDWVDVSNYDIDVCIWIEDNGKVIRRFRTKATKESVKNLKSYKLIRFK